MFRSKKQKAKKEEIITHQDVASVTADCTKLILDNTRWEASHIFWTLFLYLCLWKALSFYLLRPDEIAFPKIHIFYSDVCKKS